MALDTKPWITTPRLELRAPRDSDLADYVRLHTDPRTYAHAPQTMPDAARCRERLDVDLADWPERGFGYAAVCDRSRGDVIGWAGLRQWDPDAATLNLYYRLAHDRLGRGLGRELARALVVWAAEHQPDMTVTARVDRTNPASLATAERAGLVYVGTQVHPEDPPGSEPMNYLAAPQVRVETLDGHPGLEDELVDLWVRVNDAGGAVGFLPGAARQRVRAALDQHLDLVRAGQALLVSLRAPDATLLGFGFWEPGLTPGFDHLATLKRLMVDASGQGRNWGAMLLAGMVGVARRELPHAKLLLLDYRSGLGLGDFYARAGWAEVGRFPGAIRVGEDSFRDDVFMMRRVDGSPLVADGRT